MIPIGHQTPSITFPVGAVIEDQKMIAEILFQYPTTRVGHMYKVKILKWKIEPPDYVIKNLQKPDEIYLSVLGENMDNIKRIS